MLIPIQVVWREGSKSFEAVGAIHAADVGMILPTTKEDECTIYAALCPSGITVKGTVVYYAALIDAFTGEGDEEEEDEQGEEGIEPVPE